MIRIRRRFAFVVCGALITIFLLFYMILNYAAPNEKPNTELLYIENKIKQLEHGLNRHHQEFGEIKKQIDTIQSNSKNDDYYSAGEDGEKRTNNLKNGEMMDESVIKAQRGNEQCSLKMDTIPQPDIQMLDMYKKWPFDNPDGGVWKQGWRIEYDPKEWNSQHKLKVFVVPHSHNDPGWIHTFEEYYEKSTKNIFANMLRHLDENPNLKFIWAEISYFSRWYDTLVKESRDIVQRLVKNGQLEFVTGGWVMPDEANSHWYSILLQLTEGQTYLKNHFNVTPKSSWSIDPFGQSATMPYILKNSGFENLLIQRTHYVVKKNLAQKKQLEFRWRQLWDTTGDTDLLTHMMPFYSYDVPHTCGPDPKVCCQFDFKRLPAYGVSCPWRIPPQLITDENVEKRAELIVDQWKKKSVLYKSRSVLIPLGDDFRYTQSTEWEAQRTNYEKLFDYINNEPSLHVEAKFGTLQDYFDSLRDSCKVEDFPSLSGDFFTYADRDEDYWSGYYTTRPFHKRQDRILLHYIRAAEMLHAWNAWEAEFKLHENLQSARRQLSIFQHHDGITGTAKDHVVLDYAERMKEAIKDSKFVMQQAAYRLLTKPSVYNPDPTFQYFSFDDSRTTAEDARPTIIIGDELPVKHVVLHNSLPYERNEIVEFYVSKPFVTVFDSDQNTIPCQISPVWSWHKGDYGYLQPQASTTKFRLLFKALVHPMGLSVYTINSRSNQEESVGATYSKIIIHSSTPFSVNLNGFPNDPEFSNPSEITLRVGEGVGASFSAKGLIKAISIDSNSQNVPVHVEFQKYGSRTQDGHKSGAYLFLPNGPATPMAIGQPKVLIIKGTLESSVTAGLPFAIHENILRGEAIEIRNLVDIGEMGNTEIIMRISTNINSENEFYTDLNGLQMVKRLRFDKIPLQANYYPVPTAMFIQDDSMRLTILSGQPLGGSSLKSGEMEIMQDRRLNQDDDRGLGQGVLDNKPVLHLFRLVLENREPCTKLDPVYPTGFLTMASHTEIQSLLHPIDKMIYNENDWVGVIPGFGGNHHSLQKGMEIAVMRDLPHIKLGGKTGKNKKSSTIGLVLHRTNFEDCSTDENVEGNVNIKKLLGIESGENRLVYRAQLTLLKTEEQCEADDDVSFCPMDSKAFIIQR